MERWLKHPPLLLYELLVHINMSDAKQQVWHEIAAELIYIQKPATRAASNRLTQLVGRNSHGFATPSQEGTIVLIFGTRNVF